MIKKTPLVISGLMLGLAALGNLLQSYSETIRIICMIIAILVGILLIIKLIAYPAMVREDLKSPVIASVFPTFTMGLMLIFTFLKPYIGMAATVLWYAAIIAHAVLIVFFTVRFMLPPKMKGVFASYYIPYVGIVVASVTAPAHNAAMLGTVLFWFGFVCLIGLLVMVTYRYLKVEGGPPLTKPLFCIYAAPTSLCLAGYLSSSPVKVQGMVIFMAVLSTLIYLVVLSVLPRLLRMPFFPSYSAFTFPFVITAIAAKQTMGYIQTIGATGFGWLKYVVIVETVIAAVMVLYTLIRYIGFLAAPVKDAKASQAAAH